MNPHQLEQQLDEARRIDEEFGEDKTLPGVLIGITLFLDLANAKGVREVTYNGTHWNVLGYCHTAHYQGQKYYAQTDEEIKMFNQERITAGGIILP